MGKQDGKGKAAGEKPEAETGVEGLVETVLRQDEETGEWGIVSVELPAEVQQRLGVIQRLLVAEGTRRYGKVQAAAAEELGVTVRSVQRLVKRWREDGVAGLRKQERSDRGEIRISAEWQEFIVKTYRAGNRGSRSMSPAQVAVRVAVRANEQEAADYPSRATVYRVLKPYVEKQRRSKSLGWRGSRLVVKTREGQEIEINRSNQVWQADHTQVDVLVVDQSGEVLGRPWLTIVVDSYSRCIMGMHLGFDAPSAWVACLALRHAILPKQYSSSYELQESWGTYGLPQYLYTDQGKDFTSEHLEQVATELGIGLCSRPQPSEGGIVERPFGTFNREFFSSLPGYVGSKASERSSVAEREACLTLMQLDRLLVRYIVDRYNQGIDGRMRDQTRIGRWEAGATMPLPLMSDRELDICLMRRERRQVYRGGYLQFANLSYRGEHLGGYGGEEVIIRYDPWDITTVLVYQNTPKGEQFVARAHASGLETETLSYREAQAISGRLRRLGKAITNESVLLEVRDRDAVVEELRREKRRKQRTGKAKKQTSMKKKHQPEETVPANEIANAAIDEAAIESEEELIVVENVVVLDYEEWKRDRGWW
ncbi:Mu transposase C-terminal domain-containing protein [Leptolyngbya ohadii]|uniref:Mu transposase C-terminal domain-containing protein n=1 Tax=Leptolyngbya ohadii TaxID=1962290 RepID=UPI0019D4EA04|nr:Mu transposase C-terminal domain-containing protein [Leptolyngbya ohadii]